MSKLGTTLAFLTGGVIGGASVWYVVKERYAELSEQDIASAKNAFHAREKALMDRIAALEERLSGEDDKEAETPQTVLAANKNQEKGEITEYAQRVQAAKNYTKYSQTVVPKPEPHTVEAPYVISPDEFGELNGYAQISLTYFDDGILADEKGVIVDDPEEIVGDALDHFGEYEEDSVFVRSDPKRCDYEILRDLRSYAEFRTTLPPKI